MHKTAGKFRSFIGSWYFILPFCVVLFLFLIGLANFGIHVFEQWNQSGPLELSNTKTAPNFTISSDYFFQYAYADHPGYYKVIYFIAICISLNVGYRIRSNLGTLLKGLKSGGSFEVMKELKKQYIMVPEAGTKFPGEGGMPIARFSYWTKRKVTIFGKQLTIFWLTYRLLVDNSNTNTMLLGTTRSGKFVYFFSYYIDNLSRALLLKDRPSFVISDLKGEILVAFKRLLEARGYDVHALNLIDLKLSMFYNPLQKVIDAYIAGEYDEAQKECATIAKILYSEEGDSKNKYFTNSAQHLFSALVLAICDKAINVTRHITIADGKIEPLTDLSKEIIIRGNKGDRVLLTYPNGEHKQIDFLLSETKHIPLEEKLQKEQTFTFQFVDRETGEVETFNVPVFETHIETITLYGVYMLIRKLGTSSSKVEIMRTVNGEKIPDEKQALEYYFEQFDDHHPAGNQFAQSEFGSSDSKGDVFSTTVEKLSQFSLGANGRVTSKNSLDFENIGFGDRPVALFLLIPESDKSNNMLASIAIKQVYQANINRANKTPGRKCKRKIYFMLDEAGNLIRIEDLDTMMTMGLGANMIFTLGLQEIIQLEKVYGAQDAETIRGACGNTVYLKSSLGKTNKSISEELGTYEYESKSRSGQTFSLDKHKSESVDDRPLMRPEELALLRKGEMVIYRTMKREDNKGKDITPRPIFIHGKNRILPSYKRLKNWISIKGKSLQTIGLPEEVGKVDLEAITPTDYIPYAKQMHANRPYFPDSFFQSSWENQSPTTFFSEAQRKQIQTLLEKEPNLDIEQNQHLLNPSTMEGFLDNWKLLKQQQFLSDKVYSLILAWIEQGIEASKREEAS